MPHAGHEILNPASFQSALDNLARHNRLDRAKLDECQLRIQQELAVKLTRAESALSDGRIKDVHSLLENIDAQFGGLAAPRTLELQEKIHAMTP